MFPFLSTVVVTFSLAALVVGDADLSATTPVRETPVWICPLPRCKRCPTFDEVHRPGVGFALEMGYGTAAIKYHNGTSEAIARVGGTAEYKALMSRLATGSQDRRPGYIGITEPGKEYEWLMSRVKRLLRKALWRPATPETAILAQLVSDLRRAVERKSGLRVKAVALSTPDRVGLTDEEVDDVLGFLWIGNLMPDRNHPLFDQLFSAAAATAGYGIGLCDEYANVYECEAEEHNFPSRRTLILDYGRESLSGAVRIVRTARERSAREAFIDTSLGFGQASPQDHSDQELYWQNLTDRIRSAAASSRTKVEQLILTGESAAEPRFQRALRDALVGLVTQDVLQTLDDYYGQMSDGSIGDSYFLFATARGAAEFAKRKQEGMARCLLPLECRWRHGIAEGAMLDWKEL